LPDKNRDLKSSRALDHLSMSRGFESGAYSKILSSSNKLVNGMFFDIENLQMAIHCFSINIIWIGDTLGDNPSEEAACNQCLNH
jgi:hypothetical protein